MFVWQSEMEMLTPTMGKRMCRWQEAGAEIGKKNDFF